MPCPPSGKGLHGPFLQFGRTPSCLCHSYLTTPNLDESLQVSLSVGSAGLPCGLPIHSPILLLLLSRFSRVRLFATPWTVAYQAPPSVGFSRQEYWGGLPFPSPGDLPNPGIEPGSPALQADALPPEPPGKTAICKACQTAILLFCISFSWGWS